jgi:hypothetical protein
MIFIFFLTKSRFLSYQKIKDKAKGGYLTGQKLVFLILIAKNVTIHLGFQFHMPDPKLKEWKNFIRIESIM